MKVIVDRNICLVCFVHNLANWHLSCTASFSVFWRTQPFPLSIEEKTSLARLTRLFTDYFNQNDEVWIKELFVTNQRATIPADNLPYFDVFLPRFNFFYEKQKENMLVISRYLGGLEDKFLPQLLQTRLFYGFDEGAEVLCYVTLSANANKQASGMLLEMEEQKRYFVVMEYGDYQLSDDNWTIDNVYLHEIAHVFQCSKVFKRMIEEASKDMERKDLLKKMGISPKDMLTEIIHASLWGECGYISRLIYGDKLNEGLDQSGDVYKATIESIAMVIQPMVAEYLNKRKEIDSQFVVAVVKAWNHAP